MADLTAPPTAALTLPVSSAIDASLALSTGAKPSWLVSGPDGAWPVQVSAWSDNAGYVNGQVYGSAAAYLAAASGTFSRASDAWRRDADRIWRKSVVNELRLHHDAAGSPLGLLVEGQRSFTLASRDFTNAGWTKRGSCTVTQDMAVARPDGTLGAMRIANIGVGGSNDIYRAVAGATAGQPVAVQCMIYRVSTSGLLVFGNPSSPAYGLWHIDLALLPDTWDIITRAHPAVTVVNEFVASPAGGHGLQIAASGGVALTVYADFANVETANALWASSPMDPSAGVVTRLADALSYPATILGERTLVISAIAPVGLPASGFQALLTEDDGSDNNRISLYRGSDGRLFLALRRGGAAVISPFVTSLAVSADFRIAVAITADGIAWSVNGSAAGSAAYGGGSIPVTTVREGGQNAGNNWFGTLARVTRYDKAYSPSELQVMSS